MVNDFEETQRYSVIFVGVAITIPLHVTSVLSERGVIFQKLFSAICYAAIRMHEVEIPSQCMCCDGVLVLSTQLWSLSLTLVALKWESPICFLLLIPILTLQM